MKQKNSGLLFHSIPNFLLPVLIRNKKSLPALGNTFLLNYGVTKSSAIKVAYSPSFLRALPILISVLTPSWRGLSLFASNIVFYFLGVSQN